MGDRGERENDEGCESDSDVEAALGNLFERYFDNLRGLSELLENAIPVVGRQSQRWKDVRNVAPELHVPSELVDEFVEVWETAFGTTDFDAILGANSGKNDTQEPTESDSDETGHDARPQPEKTANYISSVIEFLARHGSVSALQLAIRRRYWASEQILTIAKSSIVFAVGSVESVVADVERIRLREHKGAIGDGEKEFTLSDLMRLGDIDSVVDEAIERRVEKLCFGSLDDWASWFKRSFKVDLDGIARDWGLVRRIVQDRHVIVHNEGRVSRLYLERTGSADLTAGDEIDLSPTYVFNAIDELTIFGLLMISAAWQKLGTDVDHHASHLQNRCYDALVESRFRVALALAKRLQKIAPVGSLYEQLSKVNTWIARQGLGEDVDKEVRRWDVRALAPRFQVAKDALLDDFAALEKSIPAMVRSGELPREHVITWPLFKRLRDQPEFAVILTEIDAGPGQATMDP
jgi:hypothetical protein